ncbi:MAG TPA: xylulokinase [Candidatus Anaerostipes avicola]|nr:FGGY family carbohydrate kinase [uncultured Anaerostipes sp.]HJC82441.1 xylulokinase [Candidatus Anaerostipes avicola]
MYYLGFDIGTSALKTVLMDEYQEILYDSAQNYQYDEPEEGYKEMNPEIWFQAVYSELKHVTARFREQKIAAVGVTGQMHTTVFLDKWGSVIRPAIMWNDTRTKDEINALKKKLTEYKETRYISKIISTGSPAVNVLWVKKNEPEHFKKTVRIMTAYDYIVYRLTGCCSCDYCGASTSSFYDIQTKRWSEIMLRYIGIKKEMLGEIHRSCDVIGTIQSELCAKLKISYPVKVIAGTGDNPAAAAAMGILDQKEPVISLGTSGVIIYPKKDGDFGGKGKNVLFCAKGNKVINICQGVVQAAGGSHKWWIEQILLSDQMDADQDKMEALGENQVLFYPHIAGDKTLYSDAGLRGTFLNLGSYTRREHMTQAVLEGIAYAVREVLEAMGVKKMPEKIRISGGGTRSPVWMKIMANVLRTQIEAHQAKASPGYGICLLAQMADTGMKKRGTESEEKNIYMPDAEMEKKYEKAYRKYQRIHDAIMEIR